MRWPVCQLACLDVFGLRSSAAPGAPVPAARLWGRRARRRGGQSSCGPPAPCPGRLCCAGGQEKGGPLSSEAIGSARDRRDQARSGQTQTAALCTLGTRGSNSATLQMQRETGAQPQDSAAPQTTHNSTTPPPTTSNHLQPTEPPRQPAELAARHRHRPRQLPHVRWPPPAARAARARARARPRPLPACAPGRNGRTGSPRPRRNAAEPLAVFITDWMMQGPWPGCWGRAPSPRL